MLDCLSYRLLTSRRWSHHSKAFWIMRSRKEYRLDGLITQYQRLPRMGRGTSWSVERSLWTQSISKVSTEISGILKDGKTSGRRPGRNRILKLELYRLFLKLTASICSLTWWAPLGRQTLGCGRLYRNSKLVDDISLQLLAIPSSFLLIIRLVVLPLTMLEVASMCSFPAHMSDCASQILRYMNWQSRTCCGQRQGSRLGWWDKARRYCVPGRHWGEFKGSKEGWFWNYQGQSRNDLRCRHDFRGIDWFAACGWSS